MQNENCGNRFIFNKVFSGSYLVYNLGNELINFMKVESPNELYNNKRFIYINPYGSHNQDADYVLHIMKVNYEGESYYELIAISKVDKTEGLSLYSTDAEETRNKINENKITFNNIPLEKIFDDKKSRLCSFVAEEFLKPKEGIRILFDVPSNKKKKNNSIESTTNETITQEKNLNSTVYKVRIKSNPQHSMCYSKSEDVDTLKGLMKYFEIDNNFNIVLPGDTEQCLAVICDRTKLEDSTSNQIAYFLSRDEEIMKHFIDFINTNNKLNKIKLTPTTRFEIIREKNHIDLFIKVVNSTKDDATPYKDDHIIIIENKIDSYINGIKREEKDKKTNRITPLKPPFKSQLSDYYEYIMNPNDDEFKNIPEKNKHFFILEPEYSSITQSKLNSNELLHGSKYSIIHYDDLYKLLLEIPEYNPYRKNLKQEETEKAQRQFLYNQFKKTIEYIKSSNAEQMRTTAYIRLKQRICELNCENEINK